MATDKSPAMKHMMKDVVFKSAETKQPNILAAQYILDISFQR